MFLLFQQIIIAVPRRATLGECRLSSIYEIMNSVVAEEVDIAEAAVADYLTLEVVAEHPIEWALLETCVFA